MSGCGLGGRTGRALSFLLLLLLLGCSQNVGVPGLPVGEDVLFADDFSPGQGGEWQLEGDEQGQALLMDGQLLLEINAPNTVQYATLAEPSPSDFVLEVDATLTAGGLDSTYGILFRIAEAKQFYRFALTGNGYYMVERHNEDDTWTRLIPEWEESEAINSGLNQTNHLAVRVAGGTFSVYANDQLLAEVADDRYPSGTIALSAGTFGQPGLRVAFDNLILREP